MNSNKLPEIWKYYFYIGFFLVNIHYLRYLNFFITKTNPNFLYIIDYSYYTNAHFIPRVLTFFLNMIILKSRKKYPVFSNFYIWTLLFILLSHEHDKNLFALNLIICLFSLFSILFYYSMFVV